MIQDFRQSDNDRISISRGAHFIGLAGVGMSATAILLRDSGVAVTGSDEAIYPPILAGAVAQ